MLTTILALPADCILLKGLMLPIAFGINHSGLPQSPTQYGLYLGEPPFAKNPPNVEPHPDKMLLVS